jgi:hypothetical protein
MVTLATPSRTRYAATFGVAVVALCSVSRTSLAADWHAAQFEVTRSAEAADCLDGPALAAAVEQAAGPDIPDRRTPVLFRVAFARSDAGYVARIHVGASGAERVLVSTGSTCSALVDAVVVAMTIVLDAGDPEDSDERDTSARGAPAPNAPVLPAAPVPVRRPPPPAVHGAPVDDQDDGRWDRTARNLVFAELLGSGLSVTLNYERFFTEDASLRVGLGYFRGPGGDYDGRVVNGQWVSPAKTQYSMPVLVNFYSAIRPNHSVHFAAGATGLYRTGSLANAWGNPGESGVSGGESAKGFDLLGNVVIGYRYIPRAGGFTCGLDVILLFNTLGALPWVGVNAGAVF